MKNLLRNTILFLMALPLVALSSCSDEDSSSVPHTQSKFTVTLPEGISDLKIEDQSLQLTNLSTGKTVKYQSLNDVDLMEGLYDCVYSAEVTYTAKNAEGEETTNKGRLSGKAENVEITGKEKNIGIDTYFSADNDDFIFEEIFFSGTLRSSGSQYYGDSYIKIYNNTDHVLYADSLVIAESDFLTTMKQEYKPNIMDTDMAVAAMYMIPGTGRDVPVQPGGKLLIVDNAVDHTVANPNSWNMTTADYEWYDESTNPQFTDIANPKVPNLEKIYCSTLTLWSPHTQGFKSYALARMHTDKNTFLLDYLYNYNYHLTGQTGEADMTGTSYRLPNSWILDAVNMSSKAGFQWIVTSPALDRGFTYNSEFNFDDSRFGKSVRRKVGSMDGKRAILMDTNNSAEDFEPRAKADPFHTFGI